MAFLVRSFGRAEGAHSAAGPGGEGTGLHLGGTVGDVGEQLRQRDALLVGQAGKEAVEDLLTGGHRPLAGLRPAAVMRTSRARRSSGASLDQPVALEAVDEFGDRARRTSKTEASAFWRAGRSATIPSTRLRATETPCSCRRPSSTRRMRVTHRSNCSASWFGVAAIVSVSVLICGSSHIGGSRTRSSSETDGRP